MHTSNGVTAIASQIWSTSGKRRRLDVWNIVGAIGDKSNEQANRERVSSEISNTSKALSFEFSDSLASAHVFWLRGFKSLGVYGQRSVFQWSASQHKRKDSMQCTL